jgi:hypothetical protein
MGTIGNQALEKGRNYSQTNLVTHCPRQIILRRAGRWTGTLPNDVDVANTPIYQDTNPENPSHYYVRYGQGLVFNVTTGEAIDLRAFDPAALRILWPTTKQH